MSKLAKICTNGAIVAVSLAVAAPAAPSDNVQIDHQAVGCVVANTFPELAARFEVATSVARARVYFRTAASDGWYYVEMAASGDSYLGRLPKPGKGLESFDYYIEATGTGFEAGRTSEHTARVVASRSECDPKVAVAAAGTAGPASIGAPPEAPPLPAGFATAGLGSVAGAASGGGAAAGAGTSTGLILGVVGAAAVGGAVAVAAGGGEEAAAPPPVSASPAPSPAKTVEYRLNADQFVNGPLARGDKLTFWLYSGGWPTLEQAQAGLAGHTASISVDGVPLAVYYTDWWISPGNPPDYHKQAMADWIATSGTHTVTGFWTVPGYRTVTRTFSVP